MTDDTYPREWLGEPPDPLDPRLGTALDEWQPDSGQRARAADLVYQYVSRAPTFETMFLNFVTDNSRDKTWPESLVALLELTTVYLIGAMGEDLTITRLAGDVEVARNDAIEEVE